MFFVYILHITYTIQYLQDVLITPPGAHTQYTTAIVTGCNPDLYPICALFSASLALQISKR